MDLGPNFPSRVADIRTEGIREGRREEERREKEKEGRGREGERLTYGCIDLTLVWRGGM